MYIYLKIKNVNKTKKMILDNDYQNKEMRLLYEF